MWRKTSIKRHRARTRRVVLRIAPRVRALAEEGLGRPRIARELGVPLPRVHEAAKEFRIACAERGRRRDWSSIDWRLSNIQIAMSIGATQHAVALKRSKLRARGLPIPPAPRVPHRRREVLLARISRLAGPDVLPSEIARRLALQVKYVKAALLRLGLPFRSQRRY